MIPPAGTLSLQDVSKILGIGSNSLFKKLRDAGILDSRNTPYQSLIKRGWFRVEYSSYEHPTQGRVLYVRAFCTEKGLTELRKLFTAKRVEAAQNHKPAVYNVNLDLPACVLGF